MSFLKKLFGSNDEPLREDLPQIASTLFSYYQLVRDKIDDFSSTLITIGNYTYQVGGEVSIQSGFLALCIRSDNGTDADTAQGLGMEVEYMDGQFYYQRVVKIGLSKREKEAVFNMIVEQIRNKYPNDYIDKTDYYLIIAVEMKDFIEEMASK